ncbi:SNARE motif of SYN8 domain-containing protein [Phanerochaete sordida]|uniref:SNARE motif of SYN8 domain-containing protein n=1 Tax=Phanerochaete sordida TaxID=48140 RepID=A0A9P3LK70_9APHY|nr:SNARE motif of SYN8 domain-containing protein [Phanerochaete sordida]
MSRSASITPMATLAKLTSLSTQTLSLLLERQRLQSLAAGGDSLHLPQITRNLGQLRTGVLALEDAEGSTEAVRLLRSQYERMRGMLGPDAEAAGIQSLQETPPARASPSPVPSTSSLPRPHLPSPAPHAQAAHDTKSDEAHFAPYTDDPEDAYPATHEVLHTQQQMMNEQDVRLDELAQSIGRQHHISLQINEELDVHHGLLESLDEEVDHTGTRLSQARRKLDRVARGAKENSSTVMIGLIIFVLLILIIVFKT